MKFENVDVYNFKNAFRGMRNPKNSWSLSDSFFGIRDLKNGDQELHWAAEDWAKYDGYNPEDSDFAEHLIERENWLINNGLLNLNPIQEIAFIAYIGPKDMRLAQTLIKAGPEHRKFLRQIFVSVDITAPLYWWKEADTYKIGTVANSTSTMHKLTSKPITLDCFETDDYNEDLTIIKQNQEQVKEKDFVAHWHMEQFTNYTINHLEDLRQMIINEKDPVLQKKYWKELVRWLPESWLQTRTWTGNYENILSMCHQRKFHKLTEWSGEEPNIVTPSFIKFAKTLPYSKELIFIDEE